jgi:hypothetical protein
MAERDKVIKSGQLTLPRIMFLVVVGGVIVSTVYAGGIFLTLGYWLITLALCALLLLIAIDYGVKPEELSAAATTPVAIEPTVVDAPQLRTSLGEVRPKKRSSRPAKRRR